MPLEFALKVWNPPRSGTPQRGARMASRVVLSSSPVSRQGQAALEALRPELATQDWPSSLSSARRV